MGLLWFLKKKKIKNASHDSNSLKKRSDIDESNESESDDFLNKKSKKNESGDLELEDTKTNKKQRFTPNRINKLAFNEVFVFGSNLEGHHNGGAAKIALEKFGAKYGQGIGIQGQSYAIPTMQGGVETIIPYVNDFIEYTKKHTDRYFLVTRIGCGIAGFSDEQIAPLFERAIPLSNVILPKSFFHIIKKNQTLRINKIKNYGQVRTLGDIVKALNNQNHYDNIDSLLNDFHNIIDKYKKRGTITSETIALIDYILNRNKEHLFTNNRFNIELFEKELDNQKDIYNDIEQIFKTRATAKLLSIIKYLNQKKRYKSSEQIINDLRKLLTQPHLLDDSFGYPLHFFEIGLTNSWNKIIENGKLDNTLLEKVIFQDHLKKVKELGLDKVIDMDYNNDWACYPNVYTPKEIGLGPVYLKQDNNTFIKSCGEGAGPNGIPNFYEENLLRYIDGC